MATRRLKKKRSQEAVKPPEPSKSQAFDPVTAEPNALRESVYRALLRLSPEERMAMRGELLAGLRQAGVNINNCLFALGTVARTIDEVTPSDLAYLIRFVRLNAPQALRMIAEPLARLLASDDGKRRTSRLAA